MGHKSSKYCCDDSDSEHQCCASACCRCSRRSSEAVEESIEVAEPTFAAITSAPSVEVIDAPAPDVLTIKSVDLCIEQNGKEHHTNKYELMRREETGRLPKLVIRRGQAFHLKLHCNRPYIRSKDAISLILTVADDEKPSHGRRTLIAMPLDETCATLECDTDWCAGIVAINENLLEIHIKPAADAPVTQWKMDIDTKLLDGGSKTYSLPQAFYLLFNPWCKLDPVYMPKTSNLNEYVLSDTTLIYRGSYNRIRPSIWKVGQFDRDVLDCSMHLISKIGNVQPYCRGDPLIVARALSAAVNSVDNNGVVMGWWDEDFPNGTHPTKWVGSVEILQKFWRKRKPVKYGQCWVFGGVVTTVARALGIPSRIVTNYSSAHDTHASLTVDCFVDEKGNKMEEMNSDSIWNYHVWNEVWMDRPDLESGSMGGYGGWQAIDATPQEQSNEQYRCGPASVLAVKLGEVLKPYDHNFLYAEVNADKLFWLYAGPIQPLKLLYKDIYGIGVLICTKAVDRWERDEITSSYKFLEKTVQERDVMLKALKQTSSIFSRYYLNEDFNEVSFEFELRDDIKIGESFSVVLRIRNKSEDKTHEVSGQLLVETVTYTGKKHEPVKRHEYLEEIEPKSTKLIKLNVTFDDYYHKLFQQAAFEVSCTAKVRNTEYDYFARDDFRVRKPDIKISLEQDPVSKQSVTAVVRLLNPLPLPLKKGIFQIEAPGMEEPLLLKMPEIPVRAMGEGKFEMIPPWSGRHTIVAKFTSRELDDVDGFLSFEAAPQPEDVIVPENGRRNEVIARTDVIA